ncbi:MAG: hypothetical protein M3R65_11610 [Gemmatimonadota bacterium]|nr:hypothetical protein [Gemmatimonadota bacterium]
MPNIAISVLKDEIWNESNRARWVNVYLPIADSGNDATHAPITTSTQQVPLVIVRRR